MLVLLVISIPSIYMQMDTCDCNCNKNEYFYEDCGQIFGTSTINNGEDAYPEQFPWQVMVGVEDFDSETFSTCGGSLITHQHVLTAAHCVLGKSIEEISVLVGHLDWSEAQQTAQEDFRYITEISIFPQYKSWKSESDVSVLTLEQSVSFSSRDLQKL